GGAPRTAVEISQEAVVQPRRGDIFVGPRAREPQSSVGATSARTCRPYGAGGVAGRLVSTKIPLLRSWLSAVPTKTISLFQPRRGDIFVGPRARKPKSSVGATSAGTCRPYGAGGVAGRLVSTKIPLLRSWLSTVPTKTISLYQR